MCLKSKSTKLMSQTIGRGVLTYFVDVDVHGLGA